MDVTEALLDSWDRQCRIVNAIASRIDEANKHLKPSEDGWSLGYHLAHIHAVRQYWLQQLSKCRADVLEEAFVDGWKTPIESLDEIRKLLKQSGLAVRESVAEKIASGCGPCGGYDNPILHLQHMVWHEGWHVGLILLALRIAGQEPTDEWEEANIWNHWRKE